MLSLALLLTDVLLWLLCLLSSERDMLARAVEFKFGAPSHLIKRQRNLEFSFYRNTQELGKSIRTHIL